MPISEILPVFLSQVRGDLPRAQPHFQGAAVVRVESLQLPNPGRERGRGGALLRDAEFVHVQIGATNTQR